MNDADLPPLIEESIPISDNRVHVLIRTRHGVYAQATLVSMEEASGWFCIHRPIALQRLKEVYSRSTISLETHLTFYAAPESVDLTDLLGGSKTIPPPLPSID